MSPSQHNIPTLKEALASFTSYFHNDLTDFLKQNNKQSKFRCMVMGGYGLKTLLETKYNMHDKVKTKDLDITVSSYRSKLNDEQLLDYWLSRLVAFIRQQPNPSDYKVSVIQSNLYVPILDYTRSAIIMVSYQYQEFADIAITNAKVKMVSMDKETSHKVGLPVKKLNEYLLDLFSIIYRANVQDVAPQVYDKRNPVTGYQGNKGLNDIDRAKLICNMPRLKKYHKYCELVKSISIYKLFHTTAEERDNYFSALSSLVALKRKVVKKALTSDKKNKYLYKV